jgi:hypothetical protein
MGLGRRTGDPSTSTPIADLVPDELSPPPGIIMPPQPIDGAGAATAKPRGLRHRLPSFLGGKRK